jgi:hypothetical protein
LWRVLLKVDGKGIKKNEENGSVIQLIREFEGARFGAPVSLAIIKAKESFR